MAETLSETEAQEKQERTQQFTELAELAKRTDLPLTAGEKIDRRALVAELNDPVA